MIISIDSNANRSTAIISIGSVILWWVIVGVTRAVRDVVIPGAFLGYQLARIAFATLRTFVRDQRGTVNPPSDPLAGLVEMLEEYVPTRYDRGDEEEFVEEFVERSVVEEFNTIEEEGVLEQSVLEQKQETVLSALKKKTAKKRVAKVSIVHDGLRIDVKELLEDAAYQKE